MSSSDLYRVYKTKTTHLERFPNGWGTAPLLWDHLSVHYLGRKRGDWMIPGTDMGPLWRLVSNEDVPRNLRVALALTLDRSVLPIDSVSEAASALREIASVVARVGHVNHWRAVAEALERHVTKPKQVGIALSCTSVSDPWIGWLGEAREPTTNLFALVDQPPTTP